MNYKVIKQTGLGVMESPYIEKETDYVYNDFKKANLKAKQLFQDNVPENIRKSSWCYESYFVKDSNNKKYY